MTLGGMLVAFMWGGIPFGWLLARWSNVEIRDVGSGNIGATNVGRALGVSFGLLTLALDASKGALVTGVGVVEGDRLAAAFGCAAILGHVYSPYLSFCGGKGVATSFGVFLVLAPWSTLGVTAIFVLVLGVTRVVGAASVAAACSLPLFLFAASGSRYVVGLGLAAAALVLVRHAGNFQRMISGRATTDPGGPRPGGSAPSFCQDGGHKTRRS